MARWEFNHSNDTFMTEQMYKHKKTGLHYTVLYEGLEVTGDEGIPSVVYRNNAGDIFIQAKSRFEDGRFEKL
jgi:hypothetical protein